MKKLKIIIITGLSGSGKSTAMAAFEDSGFYCVDNMPVALLPKFLELPVESDPGISGLAFVMDLREKGFISAYGAVFDDLRKNGYNFKILFLEADEDVLLKRYSETRRQHPLSQAKSVREAISTENDQLQDLRRTADHVINTTNYNVHALKAIIGDIARENVVRTSLRINVLSFGYKFGVPHDADLMVDVRFLPNPYFVSELKELDGKSAQVQNYVLGHEETREFLTKYLDLLDYLIPRYEKEGKAYLTIAVGCTGGRHRSVAIAESIFQHISKPEGLVSVSHRDIDQ